MTLHPATLDDAPELAQILFDWIDETPWMPKLHTPQEDVSFLRRLIRQNEVTVARKASNVQGFMARDGDMIHALYFKPDARGQGQGTKLLNQAKASTNRIELWTFQANTRARAFYAREGFAEVEFTNGQGNDEKQPDVRLIWQANT